MVLAAGLNSTNLENLVKCLYPCQGMRHFMIVTKKLLLSDIEINPPIAREGESGFSSFSGEWQELLFQKQVLAVVSSLHLSIKIFFRSDQLS